jgi:predicted RNA-binding protein with PUA domain
MASLYLFSNLPMDLIKNILTFNKNFVIRRGEIMTIKKIPKDDPRYCILMQKPKIKEMLYNASKMIARNKKKEEKILVN